MILSGEVSHQSDVWVDTEASTSRTSCMMVSSREINGPSSVKSDEGGINRALSSSLHRVEYFPS